MRALINFIKRIFTDDNKYGVVWEKHEIDLVAKYHWDQLFDKNKCPKCGK